MVFPGRLALGSLALAAVASLAAPPVQAGNGPYRYILVGHIGGKGSGPGQFAGSTRGVAIDQSCGEIYISDTGKNVVERYDADGKFLNTIGGPGPNRGQLDNPAGLFLQEAPSAPINPEGPPRPCSGGGALWVADQSNHAIDVFSPDGNATQRWCGDSRAKDCDKVKDAETDGYPFTPTDVWVTDNSVLLAGYVGSFTSQFSLGGEFIRRSDSVTQCCLSVAAWAGQLWGTLSDASQVAEFSLDSGAATMRFIRKFGSYGVGPSRFRYTRALTVGRDGKLYVLGNDNVEVFSPAGTLLSTIAASSLPYALGGEDIAVRYDGTIYVTGAQSYGAVVFSPGPIVKLAARPKGKLVTFTGTVKPAHAHDRLVLQQSSGGGWKTFATLRLNTASAFTYVWHPRAFVTYTVRAYFADPHRYHANRSSNVVDVTPR